MIFRILSGYVLLIIALTSPVFYIFAVLIFIITWPYDRKKKKLLQLYTCFWGSFYTWIMPTWRITARRKNNVQKNRTYMIVCNHQSQLDILVNFRLFFHYKIVSKSEIFRLPFIGWNMFMNNYIQLRRGQKDSIDRMMKDCDNHLKAENSVFFYPEGTRSKTGEMKEFKTGAFILALNNRVPILPIVIDGTLEALPKHEMTSMGAHDITVDILPEIPYEAFKNKSPHEAAEYVRGIMSEQLKEIRSAKHKKNTTDG